MRSSESRRNEIRANEIDVEHNGLVWVVTSPLDAPHRFVTLADAMAHARSLRDMRPAAKPKVMLRIGGESLGEVDA